MNPEFDDLEAELRQIKPVQPRRELREAIANEINPKPKRAILKFSLFAAAAAAVVIVVSANWRVTAPSNPPVVEKHKPREVQELIEAQPSVAVYMRAAAASPEMLDEVLAAHASRGLRRSPEDERFLRKRF